MDYIYDIVLNFQNNYHDFYEWKLSDKIINIKKIPVYLVNNIEYLNLKYNDITLDIQNKTIPNKMFLITNGTEVMGLLLDRYGNLIKRSSLLLDEADEVLAEKETIKALPIKYKRNIEKPHTFNSRIKGEKANFLKKYFSNLNIEKDKYLLKYIYFEVFQKQENNIDKIYNELNELMITNLDKLYNSIKQVNTELKL